MNHLTTKKSRAFSVNFFKIMECLHHLNIRRRPLLHSNSSEDKKKVVTSADVLSLTKIQRETVVKIKKIVFAACLTLGV